MLGSTKEFTSMQNQNPNTEDVGLNNNDDEKHDENYHKIDRMMHELQEKSNLIGDLEKKLKDSKDELQDYQQKLKELLPYKTEFETTVNELRNDKQKLLNERNSSSEIEYNKFKQEKEYFESHSNDLERQLKEKVFQIRSLEQKNVELEEEASKYQSALGAATDFDQDQNVKFNKDILELHDTLENYVTNLKPKIDVNVNKAKELLSEYECRTKISDNEPNKPLIKAVLQRYVLENILKQAKFYFKENADSKKEGHFESRIVSETTKLSDLLETFYNNRLGDDEITRLAPVRLRQQAFTALGTRGFSDTKKSDSKSSKHNFIRAISKRINEDMNTYRKIKDKEKRKYVNSLAEDLVRNVVRIFYFRFFIQEPIAECYWFKNGEKIDKSSMKGSWNDNEIGDMVVEVCSFPLIRKRHSDGFKIFTPARVFPRYDVKQSIKEKAGLFLKRKLKYIKNTYLPNNDEYYYNERNDSDDSNDSDEPDESDESDESESNSSAKNQ